MTLTLALLIQSAAARALPPRPPLPYVDHGACPFECCQYGAWTATEELPVYASRNRNSKVLFRLKTGEQVTSLGGLVVTSRLGRARVLENVTFNDGHPPVACRKGDLVYALHYNGEGYELLWFKGMLFNEQVAPDKIPPSSGFQTDELEWLELPTATWWVQLKDSAGRVGWTDRPELFDGSDGCD